MKPDTIAKLLEQAARAIYEAPGSLRLGPGQWAVLRYLSVSGKRGRTEVSAAEYLGVPISHARASLRSLERKHLIVTTSTEERKSFDLTSEGRSQLERDPIVALAVAITTLSATNRASLADSLERIYDATVRRSAK